LNQRKKGGIGSRTDPCSGNKTYLSLFVLLYVIQLVKIAYREFGMREIGDKQLMKNEKHVMLWSISYYYRSGGKPLVLIYAS
jgi:hypothetical protein